MDVFVSVDRTYISSFLGVTTMNNSDESEFSAIIDEDNFEDRADEFDVLVELAGGKKLDEDEEEGHESQLKRLIEKGKEDGYLTYEQLTESLPKSVEETEAFENIVLMFEEMGISIVESGSDALDVKSENETQESSEEPMVLGVDSGVKTMDPVRCICAKWAQSLCLLREGEIKIAKRIEEGIRETMSTISSYPGTVEYVLASYQEIIEEGGDVSSAIAGFLDPEDEIPDMSEVAEAKSSGNYQASEGIISENWIMI